MIARSFHRMPTVSQPSSPAKKKYMFQGVNPNAVEVYPAIWIIEATHFIPKEIWFFAGAIRTDANVMAVLSFVFRLNGILHGA